MNYLKICQITQQNTNQFYGLINACAYSEWQKIDPKIWLLEGIHQFAVHAVKRFLYAPKKIYLPAQIKNLQISEKFIATQLFIQGKIIQHETIYGIDFQVQCEENISTQQQKQIATGQVYVAELSGEIK